MDNNNAKWPPGAVADSIRVGIAGTGRLAQAIGALLTKQGLPPEAIAGRNRESTLDALRFTGAGHAVGIEELGEHADVVLLAVSDDAITDVARQLADAAVLPKIALHTCGSAGPELLQPLSEKGISTGVIHPLQTIPSREVGVAALARCYYGYCGEGAAQDQALRLIRLFGGTPIQVPSNSWALYHAAAITACNYSVTLSGMALDLLELAGIERGEGLRALGPILRNSLNVLLETTPESALTGPIRRGDIGTVFRHLDALEAAPAEIRNLYRAVGLCTVTLAHRAGLSDEAADRLRSALTQETI
ncbi:MAG: DUF2520 domain-containing protein [Bryobacterales bacterium]|nr:DUF2520 domain-containing protein [Bryobacterales bacterium]